MYNSVNKYYEDETQYFDEFKSCDPNENLIILHVNAQSCANFETFDSLRFFVNKCDSKIIMSIRE